MSRTAWPVAAVALLLSVGSARALDPELLKLADPEANVAAGVRLADMAASPLMAPLLEEARASSPEAFEALEALGPDPFSLIEEILVFGHMDPEGGAEKSDPLVLVRGPFSEVDWQSAVCAEGCTASMHGGMELRRVDAAEDELFFVELDGGHAALGSGNQVRSMIDRRAAGGIDPASVETWVSTMNDAHFWLSAKGPFNAPEGQADNPMLAAFTEGLVGLGFGLTLADDVVLGLELSSDSEENAQKLFATVQAMLGMASMSLADDPDNAEMAQMLDKLSLTHDRARVQASLSLPADELMAQIAAKMAEQPEEVAEDGPANEETPAAAQPRERKSSGGKITIHGLEEEPVEVDPKPSQP